MTYVHDPRFMCVYMTSVHDPRHVCVWRLEDNLRELFLFFHSGIQGANKLRP